MRRGGRARPTSPPSRARPRRHEHQVGRRRARRRRAGDVARPGPGRDARRRERPGRRRRRGSRPSGPRRSSARPGVTSVGIGVPGLYDPAAGTTRFLVNFPGAWAGRARGGPGRRGARAADRADQRRAGVRARRAAAWAPRRGASSMIGLTLGTGVGGVIAIDGRVHQGHDGTGGELGHQTLEPDGPPCGCGNRGCLEAFARADRIAAACGTATAEEAMERGTCRGPGRRSPGCVVVGRYLGIGIANMIVVVKPDVVVIGGGIAAAFDLLARPDRGGAARARAHDRARSRRRGRRPSSGRGPGRSGRPSTAPRRPSRDDPAAAPRDRSSAR